MRLATREQKMQLFIKMQCFTMFHHVSQQNLLIGPTNTCPIYEIYHSPKAA